MLSNLILLKPCEIKFLFVCILQERKLMLILQKKKTNAQGHRASNDRDHNQM